MIKLLKIILGLGIIGFVAFSTFVYLPKNSKGAEILSPTVNGGDNNAGREILNLLNSLSSVSFNIDFFGNRAFESLIDFSVTPAPGQFGRENPFSPIGGSVTPPASPSPAAPSR